MARRRHERVRISLPVRVFGTDDLGKPFNIACESVDVSLGGARVTRPSCTLRVGDVIGMQHGNARARYQIRWLSDIEVGVALLDESKNIWGIELPKQSPDNYCAIDHSSVEIERLVERPAGQLPINTGSLELATPDEHTAPTTRLEWSVAQLKLAVNDISRIGAHPQVLIALASAVESLRSVAFWARHHLATKDSDPAASEIAPNLARSRAKTISRDLRTLRMDLQSRNLSIDCDEVPDLAEALTEVSSYLGSLLHHPIPASDGVRPQA